MYPANVFKIFLASPSDVPKERQIAREVIQKWNDLYSENTGIILQAIGWETHSYPSMGDRAQGIINKQILKDADFLVGIFWTRIGTSTGKHESGTLEEIREHINAGKPAMICFSDQPVQMGSVDQEQYNKLVEFKQECYEKGLVSSYDSFEVFKSILSDALVRRAQSGEPFVGSEKIEGGKITPTDFGVGMPKIITLSPDAKDLLLEASNDVSGNIMKLAFIGGLTLQANGRHFLTDRSPREKARWEAALNQLIEENLAEEVGHKGEIFRVTHYGYQIADQIKNA
ncbi:MULTISPECIES: hypothetical protein [Giesbergeria]|uniref:DUF4062 domain-containing protein n=1 Tax=Giesbergeria sinuosa TaxID=80883 RepID=A0ABV9QGN2_9BURK